MPSPEEKKKMATVRALNSKIQTEFDPKLKKYHNKTPSQLKMFSDKQKSSISSYAYPSDPSRASLLRQVRAGLQSGRGHCPSSYR